MMNNKITHGKICRKIDASTTQTPTPVVKGSDILEPTGTLNFYVGSVCSEEILSVEAAKDLYNNLSKIFNE